MALGVHLVVLVLLGGCVAGSPEDPSPAFDAGDLVLEADSGPWWQDHKEACERRCGREFRVDPPGFAVCSGTVGEGCPDENDGGM